MTVPLRQRACRIVRSWFGWPVPAAVRVATAARFGELVATANATGFRAPGDLRADPELTYLIVPYWPEPSPRPAWKCWVVAWPDPARLGLVDRPKMRYDRIDVPCDAFSRLRRANRRQRDQLLHWLALDAAQCHRARDRDARPPAEVD